jgi:hypothetical protein
VTARPPRLPVRRALALVVALALASPAAPAAAARDHGEFSVAARAGAIFPQPFSRLGASFLAGVEVAWAAPILSRRLALAADLGVSAPEAAGSGASPIVGGNYGWHAMTREVVFGLLVYFRQPIRRFTLYLGVGPRLVVADTVVGGTTQSGARLVPAHDSAARVAAGVTPGFGVRTAAGQIFLEVPMCFGATVAERLTGAVDLGWLGVAAGWRVAF